MATRALRVAGLLAVACCCGGLRGAAAGRAVPRHVLVSYVYHDALKTANEDLHFFVRVGLPREPRADLTVGIVHVSKKALRGGHSFYAGRSSGTMMHVPSNRSDVILVAHHAKHTHHAHSALLRHLLGSLPPSFLRSPSVAQLPYSHYVFINAGMRGPFLPGYWPRTLHWSHAFTQPLDEQETGGQRGIALVASSLGCVASQPSLAPASNVRVRGQKPAPLLWATDRSALSLLVNSALGGERLTSAIDATKPMTKPLLPEDHAIARLVLAEGLRIYTPMLALRHAVWGGANGGVCSQTARAAALEGAYHAASIEPHPLESVFYPTIGLTNESATSGAGYLRAYTGWALGAARRATTDAAAPDDAPLAEDASELSVFVSLAYQDARADAQPNLRHFLRHGLPATPRDDVTFGIIINDFVCGVALPAERADLHVLRRVNRGLDFGAHLAMQEHLVELHSKGALRQAGQSERRAPTARAAGGRRLDASPRRRDPPCEGQGRTCRIAQLPFTHYVFLNAGMRGPFLPGYWPQLVHWSAAYARLITPHIKMVGSSIACLHPADKCVRFDPGCLGPKVEAFFWATDRAGLLALHAPGTVFQIHGDKRETILKGEYGASRTIMDHADNFSIATTQLAYQSVPWRNRAYWTKGACNNNLHPSRPGTYFGLNIHPLESLFHKTSWANCPKGPKSCLAPLRNLPAEVDAYTRWAGQS